MKKCNKCEINLNNDCFHKHIRHKDGLASICKECTKKRRRSPESKEKDRLYKKLKYKKNSKSILKNAGIYKRNRDNGLYSRYESMVSRCRHKSNHAYKHYGGRGIICIWNSYTEFKSDLYQSYIEHLEKFGVKNTTLDRINVDGNYCKENCRWATWTIQNNNRRISYTKMTAHDAHQRRMLLQRLRRHKLRK